MCTSTRHFIRHYLEMIAAMIAGMVVLGIPAEGALHLIGSSTPQLQDDAPAIALLGMATIMTTPMVALMRYRGHAWRPCWEMSASMFIPTFGVIAALGSGQRRLRLADDDRARRDAPRHVGRHGPALHRVRRLRPHPATARHGSPRAMTRPIAAPDPATLLVSLTNIPGAIDDCALDRVDDAPHR
jgi:hypothetical protein